MFADKLHGAQNRYLFESGQCQK